MYKAVLKELTKQLNPTGRAFNISADSTIEKLNAGLIKSESRMHEDIRGVLSSILPDNENFTVEAASRWEQFLGMITNEDVPLEDRKQAIIRKMNHPGTILARQSADYLQSQLQLAGFNVFVHENIPESLISDLIYYFEEVQFGEFQFGQVQFGQKVYKDKVANNIIQLKDISFLPGDTYRNVFFVGGEVFGDFANVSEARKDEFRQLILKIKPAQTVAYLLINYV